MNTKNIFWQLNSKFWNERSDFALDIIQKLVDQPDKVAHIIINEIAEIIKQYEDYKSSPLLKDE